MAGNAHRQATHLHLPKGRATFWHGGTLGDQLTNRLHANGDLYRHYDYGQPSVAPIHDRMPVILPAEHFEQWLDSAFENATALQNLLKPYAAEKMSTRAVSRNVNKVGYNQADCLAPTATQGELF